MPHPTKLLTIIFVIIGALFLYTSVGMVATTGVCFIALAMYLNCSALEIKEEQHYEELHKRHKSA